MQSISYHIGEEYLSEIDFLQTMRDVVQMILIDYTVYEIAYLWKMIFIADEALDRDKYNLSQTMDIAFQIRKNIHSL